MVVAKEIDTMLSAKILSRALGAATLTLLLGSSSPVYRNLDLKFGLWESFTADSKTGPLPIPNDMLARMTAEELATAATRAKESREVRCETPEKTEVDVQNESWNSVCKRIRCCERSGPPTIN